MPSIYSAGSASVQIVPDFKGAQLAIDEWFARQGPLDVPVRPELDQASLAAVQTQLNGLDGHATVRVDADTSGLKASIQAAIASATADAVASAAGGGRGGGGDGGGGGTAAAAAGGGFFGRILRGTAAPIVVPAAGMAAAGGIGWTGAGLAIHAIPLISSMIPALGALGVLPAMFTSLGASMVSTKVALDGVSTAFKGLSDTATPAQLKASQQALAEMAPSAREFVLAMAPLQKVWDQTVKAPTQQAFFQGLAGPSRQLADVAMPQIGQGLTSIAQSSNQSLLLVIQQLISDSNIFADIWKNIDAARANSIPVFRNVLQVLVQLTDVGSKFLPQMAAHTAAITQHWMDWVNQAAASGHLFNIMQTGLATLHEIVTLLTNIGKIFFDVFSVAHATGNSVLQMFVQLTGQLAAFLKTAPAVSMLNALFEDTHVIVATIAPILVQFIEIMITQLGPILRDIHPLLVAIATAFQQWFAGMQPVWTATSNLVNQVLPPLVSVATALLPVLTQIAVIWAGWAATLIRDLTPVLVEFAKILGDVAGWLSKHPLLVKILVDGLTAWWLINVKLIAGMSLITLATKAWAIAQIALQVVLNIGYYTSLLKTLVLYAVQIQAVGVATKIWTGIQWLLNAAMDANPLGLIVLAIAAVIAAVVLVITHWKQFKEVLSAVWAWIVSAWNTVAGVFVTAWNTAWNRVRSDAETVWNALKSAWDAVVHAFVSVWNTVSGGLVTAWNATWNAIKIAFQAVWNVISSVVSTVWQALVVAWNAIAAAIKWAWDNVIHPVWTVMMEIAKVLGMTIGVLILGPVALAWKGIQLAIHGSGEAIQRVWTELQIAGDAIFNHVLIPIFHALQTAWNAVWTAMKAVNDNVIQPTWHALEAAATWMWTNVLVPAWNGITIAWHALGDAISWVYNNVILVAWHAMQAAAQAVGNFLVNTWNSIRDTTVQVWTAISNFMQNLWNTIKNFIVAAASAIWTYLVATWNNVKNDTVSVWNAITGAIQSAWNAVTSWLHTAWSGFIGWWDSVWNNLKSGLIQLWNDIVSGVETAWHAVEDVVATPINFVIKYVFDDGLFAAWNWVVDNLGLPGNWKAPGWAQLPAGKHFDVGGYTGDGMFGTGGRYDPAGVVHAGEFVFDQQKTRMFLPLFEYLHGLPGYDSGGLVGSFSPPANLLLSALTSFANPAAYVDALYQMLHAKTDASGAGGQARSSNFLSIVEKLPGDLFGHMWDSVKSTVLSTLSNLFSAQVKADISKYAGGGGGGGGGAPASRSGNVSTVQSVAAGYGWGSGAEWDALVAVINRESGFNNSAQNPTSTAYGMFQFLDSTWAGYPYGKTSDPYQQAVDGLLYIKNRYGDPLGALAHENAYGWYDQGGWLPPGLTTVFNGTGRPELVLNPGQQDTLARQLAANGGGTGQLFRDLNLYPQSNNVAAFADEVVYKLRVAARGGVWATGGGA